MVTADPQSQSAAIAQAVGFTLSNWGLVEIQLAQHFAIISDMPRTRAMALIESIVSFDARLGAIDALMTLESVSEIEHEMWKRFVVRLNKHYKRRNKIAHFSIAPRRNKAGVEEMFLSPFLTEYKFTQGRANYLPISWVHEFSEACATTRGALTWFSHEARRRREPQLECLAQEPPLVPCLRDLAVQILKERQPRRKS